MKTENQPKERKEHYFAILPFLFFIPCILLAMISGSPFFFIFGAIALSYYIYEMLKPQNLKRLLIPRVFLTFAWLVASTAFFIAFFLSRQ